MTGPTPIHPDLDNEVLSAKQVAHILGVHPHTVYARVNDGSMQAVKRGGRLYIRRRWVDDYLTPGEVSA
jgi:excisionase family DNA binding protein